MSDRFLTMLVVGEAPVHLALKPDGGENLSYRNAGSDSVSEIATGTNEVGGTYLIGSHPAYGLIGGDNGTLWVANSGTDAISLYSIDDGRLVSSVHTGAAPSAMAFSADEHLLLAADVRSSDVLGGADSGQDGAGTVYDSARWRRPSCDRSKSHGQELIFTMILVILLPFS